MLFPQLVSVSVESQFDLVLDEGFSGFTDYRPNLRNFQQPDSPSQGETDTRSPTEAKERYSQRVIPADLVPSTEVVSLLRSMSLSYGRSTFDIRKLVLESSLSGSKNNTR